MELWRKTLYYIFNVLRVFAHLFVTILVLYDLYMRTYNTLLQQSVDIIAK